MPFRLRKNEEADTPLIMQSWLSTVREFGPRWLRFPPKRGRQDPLPDYMPSMFFDRIVQPRLRRILYDEGATVACSVEDPGLVYGFRVGGGKRLHFIFVKSHYRRMGIAKALCAGLPEDTVYTLTTPTERRVRKANKIPDGWRFDMNGMWRLPTGD